MQIPTELSPTLIVAGLLLALVMLLFFLKIFNCLVRLLVALIILSGVAWLLLYWIE